MADRRTEAAERAQQLAIQDDLVEQLCALCLPAFYPAPPVATAASR